MPTPFFADLVRELCHEGGTGPLTPTGAVPGHRRFASAVPADTEFHYAIAGIAQPGEWEVGSGRLDAAGRLVREAVAASSDDGGRVDFAPGLKTLALTVGAGWFAAHDTAVAALDAADDALAAAIAAKQPLSTAHPAAATGADDDLLTVRRGAGWVNLPLAALVRRGADGRVGIGAASPAQLLELAGGSPRMRIAPAASEQMGGIEIVTNGAHDASFTARGSTGELNISVGRSPGWGGSIRFITDTSERMRLTAAGSLGIGTDAPAEKLTIANGNILLPMSTDTVGALLGYSEFYPATIDGVRVPVYGLKWAKPASESNPHAILAGHGGAWIVTGGNVHLRVLQSGIVSPGADNGQPLGAAAYRWSVVYAGTGAINTSDARDKTWRGAPSPAEMAAAKRIAAELGFYQWNDAVAEKGEDGARLHFGVRAQAVWAIMADEGLADPVGIGADPTSRHAFLCWDRWAEERDAEGRIVRAAGERFGIRPDQLALFLIAAQEARLAALEVAA